MSCGHRFLKTIQMLPEYVNISLSVLGGVIMGSEEAKTESFRSGVGVMREGEVVGMRIRKTVRVGGLG